MKRTTSKVQAYITQFEKKNECLNRLAKLSQNMSANAVEYEKCTFDYFGLLMDDVSKGRALSEVELDFVKKNQHLLKKYPKAKRQLLTDKLVKIGLIKSEKDDKTAETKVVYKTYDEMFPSTDMSQTIEKSVKKLKDAYVYLKPAIKLCDKLLDYIRTLKFAVTVKVNAPKPVNKNNGKDIPMTM
ncbi:MAG: hypothetical protein IJW28_04760 [Clostridia bacterium]|nr:hypothetical protein [Clostridia bacterium]